MVTHDQDEALSMADRVVLMHRGRVEQAGTPASLYAQPRSAFVAAFVGRMNLWQGTVMGAEVVRVGSVALDCQPLDAVDPAGVHGDGNALVPGQRVRVGIRPEQVELQPHDHAWHRAPRPATLPANTVLAVVGAIGFHGAHIALSLRCEAMDATIEVELPTPVQARLPLKLQESVRLHFPPAALRLLAGS
jgi:iron(III) transport system ATP-binding protein